MKKNCWLALIAIAFCLKVDQIYKNGRNLVQFDVACSYIGNDVPGNVDVEYYSIEVSSNTTLSQVLSLTTTTVRNDATTRGYTIPSNKVITPQFTGN